MTGVRVLIVDDHELVRLALKTVIEEEPDLRVVGEACTGEDALRALENVGADVVLLDLHMPGMSGVKACEEICARWPDVRVVVLTSYDEDEEIFGVLSAGAAGYLMKDSSPDSVLHAIRSAVQGATVLDSAIAKRVIAAPHATEPDDPGLSAREHEVLDLMARGMTNHQIAHALWVSEATVKTHVSRILHKLGAPDRAQAVLEAVRRGLVSIDG
ncbi:MAG: response regulator transcription factor [Anaerosomatales bacterium]|nr:response regulator transcription factor [Anaerosomatales bacterium]